MVGGPEEIRRLARRVGVEADRVREVARRVSDTRSVPWQSPAADAFRESVTLCLLSLHRTAGRLEEAAALLHVHAGTVEAALDALPLAGVVEQLRRAGRGR